MWNYRVVRKKYIDADAKDKKERTNFTYAIHEAYYDRKGHVGAITQDPIEPFGENIEELRHAWVMMAESFGQPILDYDNIPEPGYERKQDPMGSVVDERLKEVEAGDVKGIPWEHVKRDMEEKFGPFDEEGHEKRVEEEREEKEKIHVETFVGTATLEELINKIYSDYRNGMSTSEPKSGERVRDVRVTDDAISVDLFDGRIITVPLAWYPRLLHATPEERANWRIAGAGYGIHWLDLDEDLTTQGLLQGAPAPRGRAKAA